MPHEPQRRALTKRDIEYFVGPIEPVFQKKLFPDSIELPGDDLKVLRAMYNDDELREFLAYCPYIDGLGWRMPDDAVDEALRHGLDRIAFIPPEDKLLKLLGIREKLDD